MRKCVLKKHENSPGPNNRKEHCFLGYLLCVLVLACFSSTQKLHAGLLDSWFENEAPPQIPLQKEAIPVVPSAISDEISDEIIDEEIIEPGDPCYNLINTFKTKRDPLPLVDWINVTQLDDFYQTTFHSLLSQECYFNTIDSLGRYNLVIEPYGFSSRFDLDHKDFELTTLGITLAGNVTVRDCWILGAGVGYWHSDLDWGHQAKETKVNSIYFGPQVTYLLNKGYIQLMVAGIYNMYDVHRVVGFEKVSSDYTGWDLFAKLGGGFDYATSFFQRADFIIRPYVDLSYLGVLQQDYELSFSNEQKIAVKNGYADFFRSCLAVQFWKEFCKEGRVFLIPSFSIGWISMQPISAGKKKFDCEESQKGVSSERYPSSNQLYLGAKLTGIHKRGILLSLAFDASIADLYSVYRGSLRFEFDW